MHSDAPLETFETAALIGGFLILLTKTKSAPMKNADLIIEPKFCGSTIWSNKTIIFPLGFLMKLEEK